MKKNHLKTRFYISTAEVYSQSHFSSFPSHYPIIYPDLSKVCNFQIIQFDDGMLLEKKV